MFLCGTIWILSSFFAVTILFNFCESDQHLSCAVQIEYTTPIRGHKQVNWCDILFYWSSVSSGLYTEDHGIVDNTFYEPNTNEVFLLGFDPKWYNSTEAIYVTAEREGKKSGTYMWGSE